MRFGPRERSASKLGASKLGASKLSRSAQAKAPDTQPQAESRQLYEKRVRAQLRLNELKAVVEGGQLQHTHVVAHAGLAVAHTAEAVAAGAARIR